ncbi:MAG: presenilin family intramembrane aspartyl protease [Candidatus Aenigmatarchaeota archaeon]
MIRKVVLFFVGMFLSVHILGLYIGNEYVKMIRAGEATPVFENPEAVESSLSVFLYIILATAVVMIIVKYIKRIIKGLEILVMFTATLITFDFLIPFNVSFIPLSLIVALSLTIWRILRPSTLNHVLAIVFSLPSAGVLIGSSLGIIPSLLLIVLISFYDFFSVFFTKHMVYLAREFSKYQSVFVASFPYKIEKGTSKKFKDKKICRYHIFQLGGGDIVIPLIFSVSVLSSFSLYHAILTSLGSLISVFILTSIHSKKPRPLPGIPFISVGMLSFFLLSLFLF